MSRPAALFCTTNLASLPPTAASWARAAGLAVMQVTSADELLSICLRSRPRCVVFDGRSTAALDACRRLKADSYTGIIPVVMYVDRGPNHFSAALASGCDEVLPLDATDDVQRARLDLLLRRSDRDVNVHPSTWLPGTHQIEADIARRIAAGEKFAMCYADLDHFKEYNDRYSYNDGDRVIRLLSRILHDVVKGTCGEPGFVGHIGGDDFIFVIPSQAVTDVCGEIVLVFDTLIPYQYSEQDRRAGYFFGKDRRGQLHRVPLMTLSIGVVTNERRVFTTAAEVSQLATEMKGYAKTLTGSVYSVDRRIDAASSPGEPTPPRAPRAISVVDD